jgi:hypothetical protein
VTMRRMRVRRLGISFEVRFASECGGASPRRSRWPSLRCPGALGFPCEPVRDARSAEWELISPLSLPPNVRGHGFQMHHCPLQARRPAYELAG